MLCIQSWLEIKKEVVAAETTGKSSTTSFSLLYELKKNQYPYSRGQFVTTVENFLMCIISLFRKYSSFKTKTKPEMNYIKHQKLDHQWH